MLSRDDRVDVTQVEHQKLSLPGRGISDEDVTLHISYEINDKVRPSCEL